ncbi:hypothetical protein LCM23_12830 [Cytobacillus kochii]|uniref:hypothetical protein n=1 Tax=Cytobacillus kochii TaxID=859143 RepID=UPI001CD41AC1|nr:hypothetical protein [Cytobacillus kochii]MCA1026978.1 hypothetical protein [Cytobacillus kochii]
MSFNTWLQQKGINSYFQLRNRMIKEGFNLMFVEAAWKELNEEYNKEFRGGQL